MAWHGMVWYGMVWYGMVWYGMVWYGVVWCGVVWYGIWHGMVWCGMAWYGMTWHGVAWRSAAKGGVISCGCCFYPLHKRRFSGLVLVINSFLDGFQGRSHVFLSPRGNCGCRNVLRQDKKAKDVSSEFRRDWKPLSACTHEKKTTTMEHLNVPKIPTQMHPSVANSPLKKWRG